MKRLTVEPGAINLIESLRDVGYDFKSAVADLIDNSISANASKVYVDMNFADEEFPPYVLIADDGDGMAAEALKEAMRYATSKEHSGKDLGKYGLGLKTASLSQCRVLTVASKPKMKKGRRSTLNVMKWDMHEVYAYDKWVVLNPKVEELDDWEQHLISEGLPGQHGTVVIWSDLGEVHPQLYDDGKEKERYLLNLIKESREHLRMVFHKFLEGGVQGRKLLKIKLVGDMLKPWDPFCTEEEKTTALDIFETKLRYRDAKGKDKTSKVTISPYILPNKEEFSSTEKWKEATGPRNWNFQQGFYFYRNGRMLQSGGWSRLRANDEHTKLLRIAVEFYPALDKNFKINISKMKAVIPEELKEEVKNHVTQWAGKANRRYRKKPKKAKKKSGAFKSGKSVREPPKKGEHDQGSTRSFWGISFEIGNESPQKLIASKKGKTGEIRIVLSPSHPATALFEKKRGKSSKMRDFCLFLLCLLEATKSNRIKAKDIDIDKLYEELKRT